jgi:hypothetical protein
VRSLEALETGHDLDGRRTRSNNADALVGEVVAKLSLAPSRNFVIKSHLSFHFAECITSPLNVWSPSISGQAGLFKLPLALISTSALSCITSPVFKFLT